MRRDWLLWNYSVGRWWKGEADCDNVNSRGRTFHKTRLLIYRRSADLHLLCEHFLWNREPMNTGHIGRHCCSYMTRKSWWLFPENSPTKSAIVRRNASNIQKVHNTTLFRSDAHLFIPLKLRYSSYRILDFELAAEQAAIFTLVS